MVADGAVLSSIEESIHRLRMNCVYTFINIDLDILLHDTYFALRTTA